MGKIAKFSLTRNCNGLQRSTAVRHPGAMSYSTFLNGHIICETVSGIYLQNRHPRYN